MLVLNYYFNYVKCKNDKKGTFLCLHDFQSNQNTFNGIINSISEEYDYYSLNLPGHSIQEKNLLTKKEFQDQLNVESIVNFIIAFINFVAIPLFLKSSLTYNPSNKYPFSCLFAKI